MADIKTTQERDPCQGWQEFLEKNRATCPEICIPGFWESLADNCATWAKAVVAAPFWQAVQRDITQWRNEYYQQNGSASLTHGEELPSFCCKKLPRIKEELLEHWNEKHTYPRCRANQAPVPCLNDLVRTSVLSQIFVD
jgi:hypothetical protein